MNPSGEIPAVSVVIPLYNSAATIEETVRSLQSQCLTDWHAVVVDDGSTDHGPQVVRALVQADRRIRLVHQANRGLAGARNGGLPHCRGRYVYFLDADDWALPGALATLVEGAEKTGAAYGGMEFRDQHGQSLSVLGDCPQPEIGLDDLLDSNKLVVHAQIIRRDLLGDERFDERLRVGEDFELWMRLAARGVRWAGVGRPVAGYRLRPASLSRDFGLMLRTGQQTVIAGYERARSTAFAADTSGGREGRALARLALGYATMRAVSGQIDEAASLFAGAAGDKIISGSDAAETLYWGVLYGLCTRPELTGASTAWWRRAVLWFDRCVAEGWMSLPQRDCAVRGAAARLLSPDAVADALLAEGRGEVTVVGFGRNGRRLARRALARGLAVRVRDDRPIIDPPPGAGIEPMGAPASGQIIITPLDDAGLAARFPGAARWSFVRDRLVEELLGLPAIGAAA